MKVLLIDCADDSGRSIDLGWRAKAAGHDVAYFSVDKNKVGDGLLRKVDKWENLMEWADLIVPCSNCDYPPGFEEYYNKGYPIFGANPAAAELELDRAKGQEILARYGVETIPYTVVDSLDEAAAFLIKTGKPVVIKPWGGESDKALTHVCKTVDDGLFTLAKWKKQGLGKSGQLMLQEKVSGVEVAINGMFGPGGWSRAADISFEHKKFMNGDLGQNTGEMGTVLQHVEAEKEPMFKQLLDKITDYLHLINYVGPCDINCIVNEKGTPLPLEFTMRLGWPQSLLRQHAVKGDPLTWMADLVYGRDSFEVSLNAVVGVVLTHGDFPWDEDDPKDWSEFPLYGLPTPVLAEYHLQQVMYGEHPTEKGPKKGILTAGTYPLVVTGIGGRVRTAKRHAYGAVKEIDIPSNLMYRTDIGDRLEEDLPLLHKHGIARSLEW